LLILQETKDLRLQRELLWTIDGVLQGRIYRRARVKTRVARTRPSMNEGCHRYLKRCLPFLVAGVLTLFLLTAVFSQVTFSNVEADLTITKSSSPDPVIAGESLTYSINATNSGPSDAVNVVITETYEANFIFSSSSPSPDSGTTNQWTFKTIRAG